MKPLSKGPGYALVGDMVRSREVENPAAVRRQVRRALAQANRRFARDLAAPLELTKGIDEFSGVALQAGPLFDLLAALNLEVYPQTFRIGVGWGEVIVFGAADGAGSMEGRAFHRAAGALARARKEHLPLALAVDPDPASVPLVAAVEAAAALDAAVRAEWTPAVVEVIRELAASGGNPPTQAEIGGRARSQQAVSQLQLRARWREVARLQGAVRNLLVALRPAVENSAAPPPA